MLHACLTCGGYTPRSSMTLPLPMTLPPPLPLPMPLPLLSLPLTSPRPPPTTRQRILSSKDEQLRTPGSGVCRVRGYERRYTLPLPSPPPPGAANSGGICVQSIAVASHQRKKGWWWGLQHYGLPLAISLMQMSNQNQNRNHKLLYYPCQSLRCCLKRDDPPLFPTQVSHPFLDRRVPRKK